MLKAIIPVNRLNT